ncbi:MAG: hypothetical protein JWQ38_829 [Flavipsychrobacter sp.]|nr:hypothetical protein [Flavipsychrobacter sp.]
MNILNVFIKISKYTLYNTISIIKYLCRAAINNDAPF